MRLFHVTLARILSALIAVMAYDPRATATTKFWKKDKASDIDVLGEYKKNIQSDHEGCYDLVAKLSNYAEDLAYPKSSNPLIKLKNILETYYTSPWRRFISLKKRVNPIIERYRSCYTYDFLGTLLEKIKEGNEQVHINGDKIVAHILKGAHVVIDDGGKLYKEIARKKWSRSEVILKLKKAISDRYNAKVQALPELNNQDVQERLKELGLDRVSLDLKLLATLKTIIEDIEDHHASQRRSSHYRSFQEIYPQFELTTRNAFPAVLFGLRPPDSKLPRNASFFQIERRRSGEVFKHNLDWFTYAITGKNLGFYGRSEFTEKNPLILNEDYSIMENKKT